MELRARRVRGEMVPDLELSSVDGRWVRLSDYRGQLNLVVALAGRGREENVFHLLDEMAGRYAEFKGEDAEVAAILPAAGAARARERGWPFAVLTDGDGRAHPVFGAQDRDGRASPVVFVADRYGEIWAEYRSGEGSGLPETNELMQWLFFINSQCPECGVPDWPG